MPLSDEQILELADPFGAFEYGDSQGDKRRGFARAIESAAIDAFLARTGKYLTNDASREAAISDATAPLLAQIAELQEKVKAAEQASRWESDLCEQALDSMRQLEAQLAEARKDAERWRWLKKEHLVYHWCQEYKEPYTTIRAQGDRNVDLHFPSVDAAIDAAIAQEQPAIQPTQQEQPRHLWDGSPWPNYVVTLEENTTDDRL